MCLGPLPVASTPLWQLKQLLVTPICEGPPVTVPLDSVAGRVNAFALTARPPLAPSTVALGPLTTAVTVPLTVLAGAAGRFCTAFQLLVLWQPLQSLPTWLS